MYNEMNESGFNPKIPYCPGLIDESEDNLEKNRTKDQLSSFNANSTRLVTKCRNIIEQQIEIIKKNKSLDYLRNTTCVIRSLFD